MYLIMKVYDLFWKLILYSSKIFYIQTSYVEILRNENILKISEKKLTIFYLYKIIYRLCGLVMFVITTRSLLRTSSSGHQRVSFLKKSDKPMNSHEKEFKRYKNNDFNINMPTKI